MPQKKDRPRLGRGLASLIGDSTDLDHPGQYQPTPPASVSPSAPDAPPSPTPGPSVALLPIDEIETNPLQPRHPFDDASVSDLASSIRDRGLLQPIIVADAGGSQAQGRYRLIAGERRLRAARLAGLTELPALIRPASHEQLLELALIENIHRADLNPVERAAAYRELMDRFGLTQQQVAERVNQPRATVANYLRLLELCEDAQSFLLAGRLSFGHAKALAGLAGDPATQAALARRTVDQGLSVRQLESLVRAAQVAQGSPDMPPKAPSRTRPAYLVELERQLTEAVGTRVSLRPGRAKHTGRIVIDYYSLEDFDRIVNSLGVNIES